MNEGEEEGPPNDWGVSGDAVPEEPSFERCRVAAAAVGGMTASEESNEGHVGERGSGIEVAAMSGGG